MRKAFWKKKRGRGREARFLLLHHGEVAVGEDLTQRVNVRVRKSLTCVVKGTWLGFVAITDGLAAKVKYKLPQWSCAWLIMDMAA